ncbi:RRM-1 domain containing protein [Pyrenophora tritici-repentis]|uniref:RNA recognition motif n=2 Tax=Pyrenophora tritici-repentis TaxID=45151 RepID=A0A2W1DTI0_9PLEO|nr:uncharacterized protein PTRG_00194 [Pyrenophora tritici-repentis Pt-1C-BFP]KAA8624780.1 hypothetical protein PtrV1_00460 [Pyrenophora tritici-repentis]EDU39632.1 predicted protein [Pyrenophora tritici-repentis Pt-1C-BFP]KAF7453174.1 RRM-1 multi-domain protein [Pyrenophora tritici-repentis]KAF7576237.1 RRM-1 multi-domain protein [Pyrenophora tritici-repentis]KAG9377368.1 RRM-1 multi-domain protein [Pyrenophora tritici-repentis]
MSTVVATNTLPINTESSVIFSTFDQCEIKEIYTYEGGSTVAWVVFETPEAAQKFADECDGYPFGGTDQKMYTNMSTHADIADEATNLLSKFLDERDNQVESHTVKITGLPQNQTIRNLNELCQSFDDAHFHWEQYSSFIDNYPEPTQMLEFDSPEPGIGLVRVAEPHMAVDIVLQTAGTYWKNATINAKCVPDLEMDQMLVKKPACEAKGVELFVTGLWPNTSSTEVLRFFKDYPIRDINMPPGGKHFCFILVAQDDVDKILARFAGGVWCQGRMLRARLLGKKTRTVKKPVLHTEEDIAQKPMTELTVSNLPYEVSESSIRIAFQGFTVCKVDLKKIYASVVIATDEVGRAMKTLPGRWVGGRKMNVKVEHSL